MTETSIFDEIPEEISRHLVSFSEVVDEIGSFVDRYAEHRRETDKPVIELFCFECKFQSSVLEDVKTELSLCYTFNALFFSKMVVILVKFSVYLRCNGVQTNAHPIMQELVSDFQDITFYIKRPFAIARTVTTPVLL